MNFLTKKLSGLRDYSLSIQKQALSLSGLNPKTLEEASSEAALAYATWCHDLELADKDEPIDAFTGFAMMLRAWQTPWPSTSGELDGLVTYQVFLAKAYTRAGIAIDWLNDAPETDEQLWLNVNGAACMAIDAARFLDEAKHLIAAGNTDLFQHTDEQECEQAA